MDAHNLATLFGPNVLHKAKGGEFQVESLERAEERKDIIEIVKELIESYVEIFQVGWKLVSWTCTKQRILEMQSLESTESRHHLSEQKTCWLVWSLRVDKSILVFCFHAV